MDKGTGLETFLLKDFTVTTGRIMQYLRGSKQSQEECLTIIFINVLFQSPSWAPFHFK